MKFVSEIRVLLRARHDAARSSGTRSGPAVVPNLWVGGSDEYWQLNHAVFCRLIEVGDCVERGDAEAARTAMAMAAAIEEELRSGDDKSSVSDRSDAGRMDH